MDIFQTKMSMIIMIIFENVNHCQNTKTTKFATKGLLYPNMHSVDQFPH